MKYQIELLVNWTNPLTALIFRASPAAAKCSNTVNCCAFTRNFLSILQQNLSAAALSVDSASRYFASL